MLKNGNQIVSASIAINHVIKTRLLAATALSTALAFLILTTPSTAQDASWLDNPPYNIYHLPGNWSSGTVPTGTAHFGKSTIRSLIVSGGGSAGSWKFDSEANDYSFRVQGGTFTFNAAGIQQQGGNVSIVAISTVEFAKKSTADRANISVSGQLRFIDNSTAENAVITTENNGYVHFNDQTSAGRATINNYGFTTFRDSATAANATINHHARTLTFNGASAGNAIINMEGTGSTTFSNVGTAANATIKHNSTGYLTFDDRATGGNATIINNGKLVFSSFITPPAPSTSTLGNAAVTNLANGSVDFSFTIGPNRDNRVSAGSIAGAGTFALGSNELTTGGNHRSTEVSGIISGANGSLVKTGSGTMTLTGANSYGAGTTISAGALQLGNGVTSGSVLGRIVNNAMLIVDRSDVATLSNLISGTGSFEQKGTGTTILTANNSYSGETVISSGRLQLGDGGTTGSVTGSIINDGVLAINRSDHFVLSSEVSGSGGLVLAGSGTTILTADNSFLGDTIITAGTLQLGDGGSAGAVTGNIINFGVLTLNREDDFTLEGDISGTGKLNKLGFGTAILTGAINHQGETVVSQGTLQFGDGSIGEDSILNGQLLIASGATLAIESPAAINVKNRVILSDESTFSILANEGGPSLVAETLQIGDDVGFNLAGISVDSQNSHLLIDSQVGIKGDFAAVHVGGSDGPVDFLSIYAFKSQDGKQYWANYDLSWLAKGNKAHGTFTLVDGKDSFTLGVALQNERANSSTGWNGSSLTKAGEGTLILAADNIYSGGTTILAGTLQLGDGGTEGSLLGDVVNNGTLAFNRADNLEFANAISGTGNLVQRGSGILTVTAANSFEGGSQLLDGTVRISADNNLGAATGSILFNGGGLSVTDSFDSARELVLAETAIIDVAESAELGLTGRVYGTGDLVKQGDGTLRLDNSANHYQNTMVEQGALIGSSASIAGDIYSAGRVIFDQIHDGTFSGHIGELDEAAGHMVKQGAGHLTLTGMSELDWSIDQGVLAASAEKFAGNAEIATDATLRLNDATDVHYAGSLSGSGHFMKTGAGQLHYDGDGARFDGSTTISDGALIIGSDHGHANAILGGSFNIVDGGVLGGHGIAGSGPGSLITNETGGTIASGNSLGTLTIDGDYIGNGGKVVIEAVLENDASDSDRLIITGDTSGSTVVKVVNVGGSGSQTREGIEVISVGGNSAGQFTLENGYVIAGAYTYRLFRGNTSHDHTNNWYLQSAITNIKPGEPAEPEPGEPGHPTDPTHPQPGKPGGPGDPEPTPEYHVGAPVYEIYPQALLQLNAVGSYQQRTSGRFRAGIASDASQNGAANSFGNAVWGRMEGGYSHNETRASLTGTDFNQSIFKMQAGIDGQFLETGNGILLGGLTVHYLHGKTTTNTRYPFDGAISTDGYGLGGSLTWLDDSGYYVDGQAQLTWYKSDVTTTATGAPVLIGGNHAFGYALSLETGRRIAINARWSVTPQAQLSYSNVTFDSFTDGFGARNSLDRGGSLLGRLGVTIDYEQSWQNSQARSNSTRLYGLANLENEFLDGTRMNIEAVSFASRKDRLWGEVGLGGSYSWDDEKYSVYGEGAVRTSLNQFGDSYGFKGNVGFRMKW